jgi:hypothetical protein
MMCTCEEGEWGTSANKYNINEGNFDQRIRKVCSKTINKNLVSNVNMGVSSLSRTRQTLLQSISIEFYSLI